jgi:integrase
MVNGRQERKYNGAWSEDDARAALVARQEELAAPPAAPVEEKPERTLQKVAEQYLAYKQANGKRSIDEDARILATRILPAFGSDIPIRQLTAAAIAQYERRRIGEVSAFTVANEMTVLRHMLRLAKKWGYLDVVPDIDMPKKPDGRQRYLELDEITRLLAACGESRNRYLLAIVTIALNTGMRKGEILGLEWERCNFSTSMITLYKTKSGKPRGVPMNSDVYGALTALEPELAARRGLLFRKRNQRAWGEIRNAFAMALQRAKIPAFRFHDLRHTAASWMVMRGAMLQEVKEVLGHADIKTTLRYAHLAPAHLRSAVARLEGLTSAQGLAQAGKIDPQCVVSPYAIVQQTK